jgi:hypothetical protein
MSRVVRIVAVVAVFAFVAIQLVPYGHDHTNPKVTKDAPWPTEQAAAIARASCYDCHSNETKWPWYTNLAPASFYTVHDVKEGRDHLNFSEWDTPQRAARDLEEVIREGSMPPREYTILHRGASLSAAEKKTLLDAIASMDPPPGGDRGRGRGDGDTDSD